MATDDEVERKVDAEAELHSRESGTGDLLTAVSGPTLQTLARVSLALFLFGGLFLFVAGVGLWIYEAVGIYATLAVLGVGSIVLAVLLAQVYDRRGLL
jgi:hypothetical protein